MSQSPDISLVHMAFSTFSARTGLDRLTERPIKSADISRHLNESGWNADVFSIQDQDGGHWMAEFSKDGPRLTIASCNDDDQRHVVVAGHSFWKGLVGSLEPDGEQVEHNGFPYHVINGIEAAVSHVVDGLELMFHNEDRLREVRLAMRQRQVEQEDRCPRHSSYDDEGQDGWREQKRQYMNLLLH